MLAERGKDVCCRCDIYGAPVGERQADSGCNSNDAASGSGWLLLRQVSVDGEAEAVEAVEHVHDVHVCRAWAKANIST